MCGSDPRISEWSIADAHVLARTYTYLAWSDRLEREDLTGRLISVPIPLAGAFERPIHCA